MIGTPRPATVFTKQQRIAELARNGPEMAFTTLAHHIDINWMHMAYAQTRKHGAVGVDGQTAADYENNLMGNLQDLLDRANPARTWPRLCVECIFPRRARPRATAF